MKYVRLNQEKTKILLIEEAQDNFEANKNSGLWFQCESDDVKRNDSIELFEIVDDFLIRGDVARPTPAEPAQDAETVEPTAEQLEAQRVNSIKQAFEARANKSVLWLDGRPFDAGRTSLENIRGMLTLAKANKMEATDTIDFRDSANSILPTPIATLENLEIGLIMLGQKLYELKWMAEKDRSKDAAIFDEEFVLTESNEIKIKPKTTDVNDIIGVADESEL